MATDVLSAVGRTNLALGIAILIVLVLRAPARRLFGARLAYPLWILRTNRAPGTLTSTCWSS
jgi:beta-lactamase regulating signal transducer with metallopeptidase domain